VAAVPATATRATPQLELLRAKALTALGRFADAERALDAAHEAAAWSGARPLLWRIGTARARLAEARGQPEAAAQAFAEAQAVINELAASVPDDALRTTLLALALHEAAPQAMPPPVDAAPQPE
jgi:tetratricopeptide (TPR) repeat protein